jgi:hypothetical protein
MHRLNKDAVLTDVCPASQKLAAVDFIINFAYEVNPRAFSLRTLGHKLAMSIFLRSQLLRYQPTIEKEFHSESSDSAIARCVSGFPRKMKDSNTPKWVLVLRPD